jgi:hypothetical protein
MSVKRAVQLVIGKTDAEKQEEALREADQIARQRLATLQQQRVQLDREVDATSSRVSLLQQRFTDQSRAGRLIEAQATFMALESERRTAHATMQRIAKNNADMEQMRSDLEMRRDMAQRASYTKAIARAYKDAGDEQLDIDDTLAADDERRGMVASTHERLMEAANDSMQSIYASPTALPPLMNDAFQRAYAEAQSASSLDTLAAPSPTLMRITPAVNVPTSFASTEPLLRR